MTEDGGSRAEAITVVGRRKTNEDAILCLPEAGLFGVADGCGGGREGDVASRAVVEALEAETRLDGDAWSELGLQARVASVQAAADRVGAWIRQRARDRGFDWMGSTLVAFVADPRLQGQGMAMHAGNSRLYRFRDGMLERITEDHTQGAELGDDSGHPAGASHDVLTRGIGFLGTPGLEVGAFDLRTGDLVLLCSDGLTRALPDRAIRRVFRRQSRNGVRAVARALVYEATAAGGDDSISVIVVAPGPVHDSTIVEPAYGWHRPAGKIFARARDWASRPAVWQRLSAAMVVIGLVCAHQFYIRNNARRMQEAIGPWQAAPVTHSIVAGLPEPPATPAPERVPEPPVPISDSLAGVVTSTERVVAPPAMSTQGPREAASLRALETGRWESLHQLAAWAAGEEQEVARLGDLTRRVPALLIALGGRSAVTNVAETVGAFAEHQRRIGRVRQWAAERIAAGQAGTPVDYPGNEVKIALAAGDLAWQELYLMVEPLDEVTAATRSRADANLRARVDEIAELRRAIVADREQHADVRAWRHQGNVALMGTLLAAVEEWVKLPGTGLSGPSGQ